MISKILAIALVGILIQTCWANKTVATTEREFVLRPPHLGKCLYQFGDQCITYHTLSSDMAKAKLNCEQQEKGIVAPIESKQKYDYMARLITRLFTHNYWIGHDSKAIDTKSLGGWLGGIGGKPKEPNCTYLNIRHSLLQDQGPCSMKYLYVCELTGRDKCKNLNMRLGGQTCYEFSQTLATYTEAQADCKKKGGVVPNLQTREDLDEVRKGILEEKWWLLMPEAKINYFNDANKNATAVHNVWVGMERNRTGLLKNQWTNSDGTLWTYNDQWDKNEPNNNKNDENCAILKQNFKLNDVPCNQIYGYFCQTKASSVWRPDHGLFPNRLENEKSRKPLVHIIYGIYDIDTSEGSPLMQALKSFSAHTQPPYEPQG